MGAHLETDPGDGEITLKEFMEGAARLRGGAKALDIWRLETKVGQKSWKGKKQNASESVKHGWVW